MKKKKKLNLDISKVKHIAQLANLEFSQSEFKKIQKELAKIIEFVSKLEKAKPEDKEFSRQGNFEKTRKDKTTPSLSTTQALKNAPSIKNNLFRIKAIFEWV